MERGKKKEFAIPPLPYFCSDTVWGCNFAVMVCSLHFQFVSITNHNVRPVSLLVQRRLCIKLPEFCTFSLAC
jgi:hypothetical protein